MSLIMLISNTRDIRMINSQNGARIKAWAGPNAGAGIVRNITFRNFYETNVQHPVVIDQVSFCDLRDEKNSES
jgi:galacturan 1,4-alpha-galacturonidase